MLDPHEKAVFDGMVSQLREDARFTQRVERLSRPRRGLYLVLAILLWTFAPMAVVFGGWTGVLMAAVAAAYGAHLMMKRAGGAAESLWNAARRPRTSSS